MDFSIQRYRNVLFKYVSPQKTRFTLLAIALLTTIALQLVIPQITRTYIDSAQGDATVQALTALAITFIIVAILQQVFSVGAAYVGANVAWIATNSLREDLAKHSLNLDMSFHNDTNPGTMIERIDGDAQQLAQFFSQLVIRIFGNVLLLIGVIIVLFLEDWRIGVAFAVFSAITLYVVNAVRSIAIQDHKDWRESAAELFGFIEERLAGTEDIRSSGAVSFVISQLYKKQATVYQKWQTAWRKNIIIGSITGMMLTAGMAIAMYACYSIWQTAPETLTIGTIYLVIQYVQFLSRPIRELSSQVESLQNAGASIERLEDLLAERPALTEVENPIDVPDGALSLQFDDVMFAYKEDEPVLENISFELPAGNILGLLGRTGSGKTTMARLIFRLYQAQTGRICLSDVDITQTAFHQLRQRIAMVTQDVQLFEATIRDNLTFFDNAITDDQLLNVIDELELRDWFDTLPKGLDTILETGGRSLSAGEAQLLAFTRVFLRDPGLVILDEASSRLDPATEQLIERAVTRLLKDRTGIIIAHRLATVERADSIMILQDGNIMEHGTRTTLASDPNSRFYSLLQTGLEEVLA